MESITHVNHGFLNRQDAPVAKAYIAGEISEFRNVFWRISPPSINESIEKLSTIGTIVQLDADIARQDLHVVIKSLTSFITLEVNKYNIEIEFAGSDRNHFDILTFELQKQFPEYIQEIDENAVSINFWFLNNNGNPQCMRRVIDIPAWESIRLNYPEATKEKTNQLMQNFVPNVGGRLLLWHGDAGTGKTFALRALGKAWREWCELHYITDSEAFFGSASYMMNVLSTESSDSVASHLKEIFNGYNGDFPLTTNDDTKEPEPKWKLLILEDAGEFISSDAKERSGKGFGRLLNIVDGLIGQGLRILILITTNDNLDQLHPAVSRPGRCVAVVPFTKMNKDEANRWLERNNSEERVAKTTSLAELYALRDGTDNTDRNISKNNLGLSRSA